jgi:DedD protein
MAFFKFRLPGVKAGSEASGSAPAESVEGMRRRARHRLIGAAVLVLVAIIGFPLVFDTQPRPVAVDVPIVIPDRAKVKPLVIPASAPASAASAAATVVASPEPAPAALKPAQVAASSSLDSKEEIVTSGLGAKKVNPSANGSTSAINSEASREQAATSRPEPKALVGKAADDGSRARALLDGKEVAKPAATVEAGRFIVQVGAFADFAKARETRLKVERAGLTTYTQVVETNDGKRIRVRVGPFPNKADAEKAAGKIRGLDLPAAILSL